MEKITVYKKEKCQPCRATIMQLAKLGLEYSEVSMEDNPTKVQEFIDEGLMEAPIVVAGEEKWSGFRPDRIKAIAKRGIHEATRDIDAKGPTSQR